MTIDPTEMVGYLGSVVVLASFFTKNMKNLRVVNSVGCALFALYGYMLGCKIPMMATNIAIIFVNAYFLLGKKRPEGKT